MLRKTFLVMPKSDCQHKGHLFDAEFKSAAQPVCNNGDPDVLTSSTLQSSSFRQCIYGHLRTLTSHKLPFQDNVFIMLRIWRR